MNTFEKIYKKKVCSESLAQQIWGALFDKWWLNWLIIIFICLIVVSYCNPCRCLSCGSIWCEYIKSEKTRKVLWLIGVTFLLFKTLSVCNTLTDVNNLLRKEARITWSQICKLIAVGIWIVVFVVIFDIKNNVKLAAVVSIFGAVLGWIFQDRVKGIASFISLREKKLLNIGDWIQVPQLNVDGEVKKVTLTSVTLSNWDTTTSTIPISALQEGHFVNLQNMSDGKTYGRMMLKTFIVDTGSIRHVSEDDVKTIKNSDHDIMSYLTDEEVVQGVLNAQLFRLYIYHWLMNQSHISHYPRLIVRWVEQKDCGLTLQVYAFIVDSNIASFEWQQSHIIEHIVTSISWFGLRLYQSPSAYDVNYNNIHIDNPVIIKKEGNV